MGWLISATMTPWVDGKQNTPKICTWLDPKSRWYNFFDFNWCCSNCLQDLTFTVICMWYGAKKLLHQVFTAIHHFMKVLFLYPHAVFCHEQWLIFERSWCFYPGGIASHHTAAGTLGIFTFKLSPPIIPSPRSFNPWRINYILCKFSTFIFCTILTKKKKKLLFNKTSDMEQQIGLLC